MERQSGVQDLHRQAKKDRNAALLTFGRNVVVMGGLLVGAQALHADPNFFLHHFNNTSVPLLDGAANIIYNTANSIGGLINHVGPIHGVSQAIEQTPAGNMINDNLITDMGIMTALTGTRQLTKLARKGVKRNIQHAQDVHRQAASGQGAGVPESVNRHLKLMKGLQTVLTIADAGIEGVETVADTVSPYGFRDLDAAGFWLAGWHPLTEEMSGLDRTVLGLAIIAPYVPPLAVMAPYVFVKNIVAPPRKSKKAN